MTNNINCTCGHSWSKASSSKKDMYVCHMCGKDNTMKDGGWLDNYGKKPNPNDVEVSTGPGFVGMGNDTTGRNYSPAWGGQFEDGGNVAQGGKSIPTTADSARLFNAQMALNNFYAKEMEARRIKRKTIFDFKPSSKEFSPGSSGGLRRLNENNLNFYRGRIKQRSDVGRGNYDDSYQEYFKLSPKQISELEKKGLAQTKSGSEYQQYYRDLITPMQNLAAPFALVDSRILPQRALGYESISPGYPGGNVVVYDYDPLAIKPYHMRTDKEKIEWEKKYGKKTPTEKSKTEPGKKKTPVIKKSEETKPTKTEETKLAPYTPTGSKKYILNGVEVSEEDFLGTGSTTGGKKRIIYSTPKLGSQKVLRLDGTPETDPEKIRKAMRAQEKDDEFQSGGFLEPISYKLPSRYRIPYAEPSSELAMSIGGEGGEPAYLIPSFKGGKELKDPIAEYKKTGEHLGGPFKTWQEADKWEQEIRHPYVEKGKPIPTPLKRWGDMAMGGSLPGAVGFTYARVAGSAPSNGKYAKKTKASAQNGKEMKFYQEGLDFKPNSIAQDGGAIVDPMGQWAHPGEVTIIPSTDITMEGVDYPVLGISDTGDQQMMYPGEDYQFDGDYVTEYPMMKDGGWLSKFDTAQGGGTFMDKLDANNPTLQKYLNIEKNRSIGDIASYFSEIRKAQEKPKNEKAIVKNEQEIKKQILAEAVANAKGKQATVKQDNRTSREKEIAEKQLLDLKMAEARGNSPFTQTLSSFTPTGSNEAAGQIFAEGVGQMTPMIGATRLFNTVRDPENNPYGIGQGNGFLANTLGTLGLLGDVFDVGAVTAPGVKAAGKYLTEQTPLKNAYKINPFAFEPTEGMMYRGLGVEGMEDALQSGVFRAKQYVEPSMVGNFDMSKRFDKAYFSPKFDVADQYGQGYIAEVPRTASDWGKRYGKKEWSQIAQRDIPITEGKILQKDWLRGYKEVSQPSGVATPSLGSAIEQSTPLKNISEIEATSPNVKSSWEPQELPGLHLTSTMEGGPISKIVEPKTGLVNVEQALGIIAKESGGASKASLIRNALGKDIPKKMDYNDFRKTVQDQLIPLDREVVSTFRSGYGTDQIGYTKLTPNNRKIISDRINNTKEEILKLEKEGNIENQDYLDILKANLQIDLKDYNNLPLENQTIRLSNKDKFGRGSDAHDNPAETLGHIHFIRDAESPDVLTMTQMQSDAFQGTHRSMPKSLEEAGFSLQSLENIVSQRNNVLESLKKQKEELLINKTDKETIGQIDEEIDKFTKLIEDQNAFNKFNKAEVENFAQKSLLDKNHQERYLQELVDYAGKRGDVNKVRVPTSETAAKVQGYKGIEAEEIIKRYNEEIAKNPNYTKEITEKATENEIKLINDVLNGKKKGMVYEPEAQTILKKYTEQPKVIKKLFGVEPKIVTDSKGNTWYEFDIPSKFKGGKGEIKAFKDGGWLNKYK